MFYNSVHLNADKDVVNIISHQVKKYYDKERDGIILFITHNNKFENIAKKLKGKMGEYDIRMKLFPKEANKKEVRKWIKEITKDFGSKITAIVTETSPENYGSKRTSKLMGFKYEGADVFYELDVKKLP